MEYNKLNEANYKEIASYKTEITLSRNETLIMEEEIRETKEKTNVLVQINQNQDVFLDEIKLNFKNLNEIRPDFYK